MQEKILTIELKKSLVRRGKKKRKPIDCIESGRGRGGSFSFNNTNKKYNFKCHKLWKYQTLCETVTLNTWKNSNRKRCAKVNKFFVKFYSVRRELNEKVKKELERVDNNKIKEEINFIDNLGLED